MLETILVLNILLYIRDLSQVTKLDINNDDNNNNNKLIDKDFSNNANKYLK